MHKMITVGVLMNEGLESIRERYGEGSSNRLYYHDDQHARDVMANNASIGRFAVRAGKATTGDVMLMRLSGVWHDFIQGEEDPGVNEYASAGALMERMDASGDFAEEEVDLCGELIISTTCEMVDGKLVQSPTDDYRTQAFVDADVAVVGAPFEIMLDRGKRLMAERLGHPLEPEECTEFVTTQINFLEGHEFHTPEAARAFPHKEDNLQRLYRMVE